jgi:two-component system, OmpR family, response regulator
MSTRSVPTAVGKIVTHNRPRQSHAKKSSQRPAVNLAADIAGRPAQLPPRNRRDHGSGGHPLQILVVDTDPDDRRTIIEHLKMRGIHVMSITELEDVEDELVNDDYDLVILDLSIGQNQGLSLLYNIRSRFNLPVITTAPSHVDENLRAAALELGADDCIVKPLGLRELLPRIRAILRRSERVSEDSIPHHLPDRSKPRRCQFGGWQVDRRTRRLTAPDGTHVPLTKGEYALLSAFIDKPMMPLSREHLLQATRIHEDLCDRSIDVQILRLRRKLKVGPEMPDIIQTVRGAGYMLMLPVEDRE